MLPKSCDSSYAKTTNDSDAQMVAIGKCINTHIHNWEKLSEIMHPRRSCNSVYCPMLVPLKELLGHNVWVDYRGTVAPLSRLMLVGMAPPVFSLSIASIQMCAGTSFVSKRMTSIE